MWIRKIVSERAYEWMLMNLPVKLMFVKRQIDSQHSMWMPRYGYTKRQIQEAEKRASDLINTLKCK